MPCQSFEAPDPAILPATVQDCLQGLPWLFAKLIDVEGEDAAAEAAAGRAIVAEGAHLVGLLAGVALPMEVRALLEASFTHCVIDAE